jgi:cytochrome c oxidase subunit 4
MEYTGQAAAAGQTKRRKGHEGPRNHLITFAISIVLTILAFAAVSIPGLNKGFVYSLLVLMAIMQVLVQLGFWMHLKDRGHFWPILAMIFGILVVIYAVVSAVYWIWFV